VQKKGTYVISESEALEKLENFVAILHNRKEIISNIKNIVLKTSPRT